MSWSAKIQLGTGGVQGYNEWQVFYDASTQPTYKTLYGTEISQPEPDILWHRPDEGPQVPARATAQNKQIVLTMDVIAADWDTVISSLIPLKLALSGSDSQAIRASIDGTSDTVRVAITPDGSSYTTYYNVLYGTVDDSEAYYKPEAIANTLARQVTFYLTVEPGGYGDTITLRNDLASSPHFIEDSDANGRADGWALWSTPSTVSLSTSIYLIGGQSQYMEADANTGLASDLVTVAANVPVVAYIWVITALSSGTVALVDGGSNVVTSVNISAANADKTIVGPSGDTWYRFAVSDDGTGPRAAANIRIRVLSQTAGKFFYMDGAYLQTGTTTAPDGWCSTASLENRDDPSVAEDNINYLDIWGIPGDLPGFLRAQMELTVTGARWSDQYLTITNDNTNPYIFVIENTIFSKSLGNGTYTANAGSGAFHGGNYGRYVEGGTASSNGVFLTSSGTKFTAAQMDAMKNREFKVLVRCKAPTTDVQVSFTGTFGLSVNSTPTSVTSVSDYILLDIGTFRTANFFNGYEGTFNSENIVLKIEGMLAAATFDLDCVFIMPVDDEFMIGKASISQDFFIDGSIGEAYSNINADSSFLGTLFYVHPYTESRIRWLSADNGTNIHTLANTADFTIHVIPRTSHLLGAL